MAVHFGQREEEGFSGELWSDHEARIGVLQREMIISFGELNVTWSQLYSNI